MMDRFELERHQRRHIELATVCDVSRRRVQALKEAMFSAPSDTRLDELQAAEAELQEAEKALQEHDELLCPPRPQFVDAVCGGKLKFDAHWPSNQSRR